MVDDEDAAIEWALANAPGLVGEVTRRVLDKDGFKSKALAARSETGEVIPGVEFIPERESFSVKPAKGAKE